MIIEEGTRRDIERLKRLVGKSERAHEGGKKGLREAEVLKLLAERETRLELERLRRMEMQQRQSTKASSVKRSCRRSLTSKSRRRSCCACKLNRKVLRKSGLRDRNSWTFLTRGITSESLPDCRSWRLTSQRSASRRKLGARRQHFARSSTTMPNAGKSSA